jgi:hypothetical protein
MKLTNAQSNKLVLLGISAFLQVAFLNCSDVNFSDKDPALFSLESTDPNTPFILDEETSVDAVECELISSKQKIVLTETFQIGSNASATRVCMSENACLRLINAYAAKRDCEISAGPSSLAASEAQCTKIFPGSKGTCHKATLISDERVAQLLESLAK